MSFQYAYIMMIMDYSVCSILEYATRLKKDMGTYDIIMYKMKSGKLTSNIS